MSKWIDNGYNVTTGSAGYLVETFNGNTGRTSFALHERPLRTNRSNAPRLHGWCGEDNNRSRTARGLWRVVRENAAGDRIEIREVKGTDLAAYLEQDGYPELIPDHLRPSAFDNDAEQDAMAGAVDGVHY